MGFESFRAAVLRKPWATLDGAYGPSDGGLADIADVPTSLLGLASEPGDERGDHVDRLTAQINGHSDVYEVTAHVLPFLVDLVEDLAVDDPGPIGVLVATCVAAAARSAHTAHGRAVLDTVDALAAKIARWVDEPELDLPLARIAVDSAAVRPAWLDAVATTRRLAAHEYVALTAMREDLGFARLRAEDALGDASGLIQIAAAHYLRHHHPDPDIAERVDEVLGLQAQARLQNELGWLFDLEIDRKPISERPRVIDEAQVIFRGADLFLAKRDSGNVAVRWPDAPVTKGDRVRVGTSPDGVVRVVEVDVAGKTLRQEFDFAGQPL